MRTDYSRLHTFRTCPRKYYWRYIENLTKGEAVPLYFGRVIHEALAAHYAGKSGEQALQEALQAPPDLLELEQQDLEKLKDYAHFVFSQYKETYPQEPWTVLAPEVEGSAPLGKHTLHFRTDVLVTWQGHPWLVEHKTTSQHAPLFQKRWRLDHQITAYVHGVTQVTGIRPLGAVINVIQKHGFTRVSFWRDVVTRSDAQVQEFTVLAARELDLIESLPKRKDYWPMYTHTCVSYGRACEYLDLCWHDTPTVRSLYRQRPPDYVDSEEVF